MKKESIKKSNKKWKPKQRWIESITINSKTGKAKYKYFIPETPGEEKRLEAEFNEKMKRVFEVLFSN